MKAYWPPHLPRHLVLPETTLCSNLEIAARRFPRHPAIRFFGTGLNYTQFLQEVERLAGWLTHRAGVRRGDRVILYLQNSPQWLISYYAILRADAVVVPINPMNRAGEFSHYAQDSGAKVAICAQDLFAQAEPARSTGLLEHVLVATYSDYLREPHGYELPAWLNAPRQAIARTSAWADAIAAAEIPAPAAAQPDDLCVLPYTSGSTGKPKACIHTHRSLMHTTVGGALWHACAPGTVFLGLVPMYHIGGLTQCVHLPVFVGGTMVPLPRWDRNLALQLLAAERVEHAAIPPTAVMDLLGHERFDRFDLSAIRRITAGGAAMPQALWERLKEATGVTFIEAYGLTETAATTHNNPIDRAKRQCLGVPFFDTDSLVVDPSTLRPQPVSEPGEILVAGPQLFKGYWKREEDTRAALVEIDGTIYFRTGDIGYRDEEGYYFMTDRAKRMINASGFNVWPAEVESVLYTHPAIKEVCVVGSPDSYRGETVKAVVVLKDESKGSLSAEDLIGWTRERMAAYKYPRVIQFVDALPKSAVGKILWRELQDAENVRSTA